MGRLYHEPRPDAGAASRLLDWGAMSTGVSLAALAALAVLGVLGTTAPAFAVTAVPAKDPPAALIALGVLLLAAALLGIRTTQLAKKHPRRRS